MVSYRLVIVEMASIRYLLSEVNLNLRIFGLPTYPTVKILPSTPTMKEEKALSRTQHIIFTGYSCMIHRGLACRWSVLGL